MYPLRVISGFILLLTSCFLACGQSSFDLKNSSTNYIHIQKQDDGKAYDTQNELVGFILKSVDTLGKINWQSNKITEFENEGDDYFLKVDIPAAVRSNSMKLWCTALTVNSNKSIHDTIKHEYAGVEPGSIRLLLKSNPEGAEIFLVPNRIWNRRFENLQLASVVNKLETYRVNTSSTNTYAYIDETVYVVVYKLENKIKKTIHHTRPASIEKDQTVWVNFY